jgi:hypothetical protein
VPKKVDAKSIDFMFNTCYNINCALRSRLRVGRQVLALVVGVRILSPQPKNILVAPSSSGLGHRPLKAEAGIRTPLGLPNVFHCPYHETGFCVLWHCFWCSEEVVRRSSSKTPA